jgi:formamidopyrimidine-DNA glycosylase
MPELPEVEVVRRGLDRYVANRTVAAVSVLHPRAIRGHLAGGDDFAARLTGRRLGAMQRRGKYLWAPLEPRDRAGGSPDGAVGAIDAADAADAAGAVDAADAAGHAGEAVVAHLGMSGQLLVRPAATAYETHLRVRLSFADAGPELRFVDQRTFGGLAVDPLVTVADGEQLPRRLLRIARDPLDPCFDDAGFAAAILRRRTGLKRALLDQSLVSGVGNIYADEALWRARLHYARPTETLTRRQVTRLLEAVREVLTEALAEGGTSFDSLYVNVNGESGYFDRSLAAYGRAGQPCRRCGTPIRREPFMNRSSFTCPRCQRVRAAWVER